MSFGKPEVLQLTEIIPHLKETLKFANHNNGRILNCKTLMLARNGAVVTSPPTPMSQKK
jgi:hypothetical protein